MLYVYISSTSHSVTHSHLAGGGGALTDCYVCVQVIALLFSVCCERSLILTLTGGIKTESCFLKRHLLNSSRIFCYLLLFLTRNINLKNE